MPPPARAARPAVVRRLLVAEEAKQVAACRPAVPEPRRVYRLARVATAANLVATPTRVHPQCRATREGTEQRTLPRLELSRTARLAGGKILAPYPIPVSSRFPRTRVPR